MIQNWKADKPLSAIVCYVLVVRKFVRCRNRLSICTIDKIPGRWYTAVYISGNSRCTVRTLQRYHRLNALFERKQFSVNTCCVSAYVGITVWENGNLITFFVVILRHIQTSTPRLKIVMNRAKQTKINHTACVSLVQKHKHIHDSSQVKSSARTIITCMNY